MQHTVTKMSAIASLHCAANLKLGAHTTIESLPEKVDVLLVP